MSYDGRRAANYAIRHAKKTQPFDASCALFASNSLVAGGIEKTNEWTDVGYRGEVPGTPAFTVASQLYNYLVGRHLGRPHVVYGRSVVRQDQIPSAQLGDLIFYDWFGDGIRHVSVVTTMRGGKLPLVSEWGTTGHTLRCEYVNRPWNWSENSQRHIGQAYPEVTVTLLRMA